MLNAFSQKVMSMNHEEVKDFITNIDWNALHNKLWLLTKLPMQVLPRSYNFVINEDDLVIPVNMFPIFYETYDEYYDSVDEYNNYNDGIYSIEYYFKEGYVIKVKAGLRFAVMIDKKTDYYDAINNDTEDETILTAIWNGNEWTYNT